MYKVVIIKKKLDYSFNHRHMLETFKNSIMYKVVTARKWLAFDDL